MLEVEELAAKFKGREFELKFDDCGAGSLISIYGSEFSLNLSGKFDAISQT